MFGFISYRLAKLDFTPEIEVFYVYKTLQMRGRPTVYRAGRPICGKLLKIMFREVPPADCLIL